MTTVGHSFLWASGGALVGAAAMSLAGPAQTASEPMQAPERTVAAPVVRPPQSPGLVCTRAAREFEPACSHVLVRALACEGQLNACETAESAARHPWPTDGPEAEQPDAWARAIEDAIADCQIPGEIEVIECREYPCVAALRPSAAGAPQALADSLGSALDRCPGLRAAFQVGDEQLDALDVVPLKVPCADADEYAQVIVAMDTRGSAWRAWNERGEGDNDVEVLRWMFRRGDDVAAVWPCGHDAQ